MQTTWREWYWEWGVVVTTLLSLLPGILLCAGLMWLSGASFGVFVVAYVTHLRLITKYPLRGDLPECKERRQRT